MNINFTVRCDTCEEKTNIRFGMSNREVQPVRFACQDCGSAIDIIMGGRNGGIVGATRLEDRPGPFDQKTNFVDIHLDFPVSFEPYVMGMTPFMKALGRIGSEEMQVHRTRLNHLNSEMAKARKFKTLLKVYATGKILPFKLNAKRTFGLEVTSDRPEDINAALYRIIAHMMAAYEYPGQSPEDVDTFVSIIFELAKQHKEKLDAFVEQIIANKFLKNAQIDALEIYPKMLDAELAIRPALFLDFDSDYAENPIPMRVSAEEFENFKDLYKDIAEVLSRQLVLVAGINNLRHRGDSNSFAPVLNNAGQNRAPASLDTFADVPFGSKHDFIDDPWHVPLDGAISNRLRNAIAHNKAEYDEVTQLITYYWKREGMTQENCDEIYFLEFVRRMLVSYREMHRLHHLIKALFYYRFLIMKDGE